MTKLQTSRRGGCLQNKRYTKYDRPLEYWSAKRFEYPRVAKWRLTFSRFQQWLPSEMTFSSAGSMVSPKRSRLDASTVAVTQAARSWLRAGLLEGYERLLKEVGGDVAESQPTIYLLNLSTSTCSLHLSIYIANYD
ncbi:hypothetical protein BKA56DRAFT_700456 [Ilyonectria sp. MPI-CAGE-AT-0026]|nr:hypothetical protein BKA56DRAFT_700456 [Ilyonectria sp. MPI-CAGE-AT-0026]